MPVTFHPLTAREPRKMDLTLAPPFKDLAIINKKTQLLDSMKKSQHTKSQKTSLLLPKEEIIQPASKVSAYLRKNSVLDRNEKVAKRDLLHHIVQDLQQNEEKELQEALSMMNLHFNSEQQLEAQSQKNPYLHDRVFSHRAFQRVSSTSHQLQRKQNQPLLLQRLNPSEFNSTQAASSLALRQDQNHNNESVQQQLHRDQSNQQKFKTLKEIKFKVNGQYSSQNIQHKNVVSPAVQSLDENKTLQLENTAKNSVQLSQAFRDRQRTSSGGNFAYDIRKRLGIYDCVTCHELRKALTKTMKLVSLLQPDVTSMPVKTRIEKVLQKGQKVILGLPLDSSDEEEILKEEAAQRNSSQGKGSAKGSKGKVGGNAANYFQDNSNKKGYMTPRRRNELIRSLQNDVQILKNQKFELEAQKLKIQLQYDQLNKRFEAYRNEVEREFQFTKPASEQIKQYQEKEERKKHKEELLQKRKTLSKVTFSQMKLGSSHNLSSSQYQQNNQQNYDKFSSFQMLNNLLGEMMYNLDSDKVFQSMGNKFEKLLSCDQIVILRILENEKLEWVNCDSRKQRNLYGKLNLRDKLIYEVFSENQNIVINEPDKDMLYHPKIAKAFHISPQAYNLLAQPILSHEQGFVGGILLAFNKKNFTSSDTQYMEFTMDDQKVAKLCSNLAGLYFSKLATYEQSITEKNSVNFYLSSVDQLFKHPNCFMFQESVKQFTAQLFNCERANFMFCDFEKGELYKNYLDEKGKEHVETFSLQRGLAGYVANSMNPLISNQIEDDTRYLPSIDDPMQQEFSSQTRSILSVPIFTSEEQQQIETLSVQCPRGVLQLINKNQGKKFVDDDVRQVQLWGYIVGRAHQLIKQLEEFNSFKSNFGLMFEATNRAMMSIDQNSASMNQVLQAFLGLNNTITNSIMNRDLRLLQEDLPE